jgi:hypothetical protein
MITYVLLSILVLAIVCVWLLITRGRLPFENDDPNKKGWWGKKF